MVTPTQFIRIILAGKPLNNCCSNILIQLPQCRKYARAFLEFFCWNFTRLVDSTSWEILWEYISCGRMDRGTLFIGIPWQCYCRGNWSYSRYKINKCWNFSEGKINNGQWLMFSIKDPLFLCYFTDAAMRITSEIFAGLLQPHFSNIHYRWH